MLSIFYFSVYAEGEGSSGLEKFVFWWKNPLSIQIHFFSSWHPAIYSTTTTQNNNYDLFRHFN